MWNVAGGVNDSRILNIIINLNKIQPGIVTSTYDCYDPLLWHGGRAFRNVPDITAEQFIERVKLLNQHNIGVYYTFSNSYIEEKHLDDKWVNYFMDATSNKLNGVVCGTPVLANYIRKKYPLFKLIGSCSIHELKIENLKQLQEIYDIVVLPPDVNRKIDLIEQLDTSRIEALVSLICIPDCNYVKFHYNLMNKWNISGDIKDLINLHDFEKYHPGSCTNRRKSNLSLDSNILNKKELNQLKKSGVKLFKIQERGQYPITIINIFKFIIMYGKISWYKKFKMLRFLPKLMILRYYFTEYKRRLKLLLR